MASNTLAFVLALSLLFCAGSALKCYSCDSSKDYFCKSMLPFGNSVFFSSEDCEAHSDDATKAVVGFLDTVKILSYQCVKVSATDSEGNYQVVRACSVGNQLVDVCKGASKLINVASDVQTTCDTCSTDYCNSASKLGISVFLSLGVLCFLKLF